MEEKKKPNIKILVACHKPDPNTRQDDIYMPIQVGAALHPELDLGFQKDDEGDNISYKNESYCELTALYWAWKNLTPDIEHIGLAHYRRYFNIDESKLKRYVSKYDIILPKPVKQAISNFKNLFSFIGMEDAYIFIDTIVDLYPAMNKEVIEYFYNSNRYSVFNMLIAKKDIFNEYCQFLFNVLNETEKRIKPIQNYTRINRRIGYMAEALLGLWILHNKKRLSIKYVSTLNTDNIRLNLKGRIGLPFKSILSNVYFNIQKYPKVKRLIAYNAVITGLNSDNIQLNNFQ
ncbi:MAG: DUF4422 domain-containing protein [Muribaculaceae bacterium]|nr:DUF4422 domain-containing protein [Muribaculaceae bacterium]